jgi:hypothetical protein
MSFSKNLYDNENGFGLHAIIDKPCSYKINAINNIGVQCQVDVKLSIKQRVAIIRGSSMASRNAPLVASREKKPYGWTLQGP